MRFNYILLLILTVSLFYGCSTDVNTNGPETDTPVVYCVLDPDSTYQYVRLNKSFLNSNGEDARDIAKNQPDKYTYPNGQVKVILYQTESGKPDTALTEFEPVSFSNKEAGEFSSPDQILLRSISPVSLRAEKRSGSVRKKLNYKIIGINSVTGTTFTSSTQGVTDLKVDYPSEGQDITFTPNAKYSDLFFSPSSGYCNSDNIVPCSGAAISSINFELNYRDFYADGSYKDTTILFRNYASTYTATLASKDFFSFLVFRVKHNEAVKSRKFMPCRILFYMANSDFNQYLDVLNNYNPVSQIRPSYNNIMGGVVLFSFRRVKAVTVNISNRTVEQMNTETSSPDYIELFNLNFTTR